jgi:hypothetical protein
MSVPWSIWLCLKEKGGLFRTGKFVDPPETGRPDSRRLLVLRPACAPWRGWVAWRAPPSAWTTGAGTACRDRTYPLSPPWNINVGRATESSEWSKPLVDLAARMVGSHYGRRGEGGKLYWSHAVMARGVSESIACHTLGHSFGTRTGAPERDVLNE